MQRIAIIGVTGSGKTTLAFNMAANLAAKPDIIELDDLFWRPGWREAPPDEFRADVARATGGKSWILTGNYPSVRDLVWARADTLVWLDYDFMTTFGRLSRRTLNRLIDGQTVCNGNKETLSNLFSKNSLIGWFFQTYGPRKREYGEIFVDPGAYPHLQKIRVTRPAEAEMLVKSLGASNTGAGFSPT